MMAPAAATLQARLTTVLGAVILSPDGALVRLARMQGDSNWLGMAWRHLLATSVRVRAPLMAGTKLFCNGRGRTTARGGR